MKRARRANIERILLQSIATTGLLAVALVAPNVIGAMEKLGFTPKQRQGEYIAAARRRLKRQGLLAEEDGFLRLSNAGARRLAHLVPQMLLHKPKRWDGKWRVLIFDIPERRRSSRDMIRMHLRSSGFIRAQDSVWIYPYPCEEFVVLLKAECRVGKDMLYMIVDSLEGDAAFRTKFGLPVNDATPPIRITGAAGKILDVLMPEQHTVINNGRRN